MIPEDLMLLPGTVPIFTIRHPAATKEEQAQMLPGYVQLQQSLLNSTGLLQGKDRRNVVIEGEMQKWQEEFGEDNAILVKEFVNASMPHYEYLKSRKTAEE
ncbi:uncharacterized protein MYCFIDRAFT_77244 [Pseudocercospora fijiensis CIRAD86]|uniref:Uncharacterized protein n=1 Tax=Pseudocercospora fijiensis (strain CIRAD86) TaxID=383855 RepID=M3AQR6_PSEFD|nr:uncharacterized protein MYCFIDRAFT_77244 [Pseudocercospora fijiensis CIRAD86]EME86966.1 hypothetical protein MYCFIDRAFT_77244 [Pseudocercospora fijiensis CIRAD86]